MVVARGKACLGFHCLFSGHRQHLEGPLRGSSSVPRGDEKIGLCPTTSSFELGRKVSVEPFGLSEKKVHGRCLGFCLERLLIKGRSTLWHFHIAQLSFSLDSQLSRETLAAGLPSREGLTLITNLTTSLSLPPHARSLLSQSNRERPTQPMSLRSDPAPSCHINKAMGGSGSRSSVSRWDIMGKRVRRDNDNSVWGHSELKTSLHLTIHTSDVLHASFVSGCLE